MKRRKGTALLISVLKATSLTIPFIVMAVTVVVVLITIERIFVIRMTLVVPIAHPVHGSLFMITMISFASISTPVVASTMVSMRVEARIVCIDNRKSSQE